MKFFPIRYWWTDRGTERTASTVASGSNADDALRRFRRDNPHVQNSAIIEKPRKTP